uniref:EF-hand domain-containing protein n=1 Tax=Macrostomum lignano TaxID=282301 RepID=A0A1I8G5M2_9PLAT
MRELQSKQRRAFGPASGRSSDGVEDASGSDSEEAVLAFNADEDDIVTENDVAEVSGGGGGGADAKSRRSLLERCRFVRWLSRKLLRRQARSARGSFRIPGAGGGDSVKLGDAEAEQLMSLLPWMVPRTRPRPLRELAASSGLSIQLLRRLYAKFKQECPNGLMQRESFQEICGYFFPLGEASLYAGLLFDSFLALPLDDSRQQSPQPDRLCFEQLVSVMSRLSRGSLQDKLYWLFALYDADKDGQISRRDLLTVVTGVYSLCGTACRPAVLPNVTAAE